MRVGKVQNYHQWEMGKYRITSNESWEGTKLPPMRVGKVQNYFQWELGKYKIITNESCESTE